MHSSKTPRPGSGTMQWQLEKSLILGGFIASAVILALVGWESYRDTVRVAEAAAARKHSFEVQLMLDETAARLVDAETGQRGYLLTGDEAYLEPYHGAIRNLARVASRLKELTSDNSNQQKRILALEPLVEEKLAELQRTIDLRKDEGLAAANRVVLGGQGKQRMDEIRPILAEMVDAESVLRTVRTQEMTQASTRSTRTVVGGNLSGMFLLLLVFLFLFRELGERKKTQEALAKSEKWFSTTLASIGDAVIATDMNGAVTFLNPVAQSLTGWSQSEAAGMSMDLGFDTVNTDTTLLRQRPLEGLSTHGVVDFQAGETGA